MDSISIIVITALLGWITGMTTLIFKVLNRIETISKLNYDVNYQAYKTLTETPEPQKEGEDDRTTKDTINKKTIRLFWSPFELPSKPKDEEDTNEL